MSRRCRCAFSVLVCLVPLSMAMAVEAADKPRSLRVAVVQMGLEPTLAENRDKIVRLIQEAAAADARLIVFPEGALASPPGTPLTEHRLAVEAVGKAARESGLYVVAPSRFVPQHHNQLNVFSPQGETLLVYDKVWHAREYDAPKMVSVDGVLCSFLICADRWSRPVADLPPVMGAQILIECSGNLSMSPAEALLHEQIVANLASYRTLTVVANPLYPDLVTHPDARFSVGSGVWDDLAAGDWCAVKVQTGRPWEGVFSASRVVPGPTNPMRERGYWRTTTPRYQPWMMAGVVAMDAEIPTGGRKQKKAGRS